jgi:hypothetical protein
MRYLKEVDTPSTTKNAQEIQYCTYGGAPMATHNMPCSVCMDEKAVLLLGVLDGYGNVGTFAPCHNCYRQGYVTVRVACWRRRILRVLGILS